MSAVGEGLAPPVSSPHTKVRTNREFSPKASHSGRGVGNADGEGSSLKLHNSRVSTETRQDKIRRIFSFAPSPTSSKFAQIASLHRKLDKDKLREQHKKREFSSVNRLNSLYFYGFYRKFYASYALNSVIYAVKLPFG